MNDTPSKRSAFEERRQNGFDYVLGKVEEKVEGLRLDRLEREKEMQEAMKSAMDEMMKGEKPPEKPEVSEEEVIDLIREKLEATIDEGFLTAAGDYLKLLKTMPESARGYQFHENKNGGDEAEKSARIQGAVSAYYEVMDAVRYMAATMKEGFAEKARGVNFGVSGVSQKNLAEATTKIATERVDHLCQVVEGIMGLDETKIPAWAVRTPAEDAEKPKVKVRFKSPGL